MYKIKKEKSTALAALLNLFLPGIGSIYCKSYFFGAGIICLYIFCLAGFPENGFWIFVANPLVAAIGLLSAKAYNAKIFKQNQLQLMQEQNQILKKQEDSNKTTEALK